MIPTGRLLVLLVGAAVPLALAGAWAPALPVFGLWLTASTLALVIDWRMTPSPGLFTARRVHEPRLSLGAANLVRILVENKSRVPARVKIRDEFPDGMVADRVFLSLDLAPGAGGRAAYHLTPTRRGDHAFGATNLRYSSRLGLFERQTRLHTNSEVRVYPNLLELRKYDLLARRGALEETGLRQTRLRGMGSEFERLRDYQPDDDYRRIHWKATARRGKPISIEYEAERSQNVVIMLDAGRLMGSQVGEITKLDHALNSALLTAYVAGQRGDRVALLAFADGPLVYLPPTRGRQAFHTFLAALYRLEPQRVESDFGAALHEIERRQLKRSLLLLFTDLAEAGASRTLVAYLSRAARHHLPVCVTLVDPALVAAATEAPVSARALYERAVADRLLDERRQVLAMLRQSGVVTLDVPADRLTPEVVNTYLELKARTRL